MTLLRQLARLAAVTVGAAAYILADSMDPNPLTQMGRHLDALWQALEADGEYEVVPVQTLVGEWAFEMYADPEDDDE